MRCIQRRSFRTSFTKHIYILYKVIDFVLRVSKNMDYSTVLHAYTYHVIDIHAQWVALILLLIYLLMTATQGHVLQYFNILFGHVVTARYTSSPFKGFCSASICMTTKIFKILHELKVYNIHKYMIHKFTITIYR